jgi:hypothetical protein
MLAKPPDLGEILDNYRDNASPFLRQQVRTFRSLSAADQRELLFFFFANMAVTQAARQGAIQ